MKIATIERTETLYETVELFLKNGYEIPLTFRSKEAPEYTKISKDLKDALRCYPRVPKDVKVGENTWKVV